MKKKETQVNISKRKESQEELDDYADGCGIYVHPIHPTTTL